VYVCKPFPQRLTEHYHRSVTKIDVARQTRHGVENKIGPVEERVSPRGEAQRRRNNETKGGGHAQISENQGENASHTRKDLKSLDVVGSVTTELNNGV
jgi:hypothetical protein